MPARLGVSSRVIWPLVTTALFQFSERRDRHTLERASMLPASAMTSSPRVRMAAIILAHLNPKPSKPDIAGAIARNKIPRSSKRVGRAICRRWSGELPPKPCRDQNPLSEATQAMLEREGL